MKKATLYLMILLISVSIFPTSVYATDKKMETTTRNPPKEIPVEVQVMLNRLKEIKAMDKSNMDRKEKNGIYISLGAILIIILLIILL